tara:strand:- start:229 stop:1296 length:1068 start_codon:yes stop_codon:yes gene_type:complete
MALSKIDVANMLTGLVPNDNTIRRPNVNPIIINGDMAVAQRATSVTSHNAVSYTTVDRFKTVCEVGTYTVIQESLTSGAAYEAGFKNALRLDTTTAEASAGSAGEQTTIEQRIEGFNLQAFKKGTSSAEKYTLAFWVKASKTGSNLQVNLRDVDNTRQIGGTYSISSADTWEHKVINFAADTTGAFGDDNGNSLTIEWFLDGGSNFSGGAVPTAWEASSNADRNVTNFDLAGSTDNDWAITGVQLEVGEFSSTTLPPFQFENFADNRARCFRYFYKMSGDDFTSSKSRESDRHRNATITYPTQMRAAPTIAVLTNPANVSPTWSNQSNERANMTGTASSDGVTELIGTISADAEL